MATCRYCGRHVPNGSGLHNHERVCKVRPPKERLEKYCGDGLGISDIAAKEDVGKSTVSSWLRSYGLETVHQRKARSHKRRRSESLLVAELAPLYGIHTKCNEVCPKEVRPADGIEALRRKMVMEKIKRIFKFKR